MNGPQPNLEIRNQIDTQIYYDLNSLLNKYSPDLVGEIPLSSSRSETFGMTAEPSTITKQQLLKVRQFQNEFMKSSFLPKYERKIVRISALCSEGRNLDNFLFVYWKKQ